MGDYRKTNRQYRQIAEVQFTHADVSDSEVNLVADLPHGAIVVGGGIGILTAFDAAVTFSLGDREAADGTAGATDRYASGVAADATGFTKLTPDGKPYDESNTITLSSSAAVTVGEAVVIIEYIMQDRGREVHPTRDLPEISA